MAKSNKLPSLWTINVCADRKTVPSSGEKADETGREDESPTGQYVISSDSRPHKGHLRQVDISN